MAGHPLPPAPLLPDSVGAAPLDVVPVDAPDAPSRLGRRRFLVGMAGVAGAVGVGASVLPMPGVAHGLAAGASRYVPLDVQKRFADTRRGPGYGAGYVVTGTNRIKVQITGFFGVPATASAAVVTITAVNKTGANHVTAFPATGTVPRVSNLNMARPGEVAANLGTVRLSAGGAIEIFAPGPTEMILDVAGYYEPVTDAVTDGRFEALSVAERVLDTRKVGNRLPVPPGGSVEVQLTSKVPTWATAVVINLTTDQTTGPGHFTCYPLTMATAPAGTSNLNVNGPGETRAAAAIVKISTSGSKRGFKVYSHGGGHVIVDVAGYYTSSSAASSTLGLFVPLSPVRVLDTRTGPGKLGRLWPDWTVEAKITDVVPLNLTEVQAIACNVTAVDARGPGHFTVYSAGTARQNTSNLNATFAGQVIANHAITRISNRGVSVYAKTGAHVLVDIAGWFLGSPNLASVGVNNPTPPAAGPPWTLEVPAMRSRYGNKVGLVSTVLAGSANPVVDSGNTWHWTGTGYMGQAAHVGLFAHRTTAPYWMTTGAPLYNLHLLKGNDDVYVTVAGRSSDRRRFHYKIVRSNVTGESPTTILNETRQYPGTTVSLIACTRPDRLPTNVHYRLIYTAVLVGVTEDGIPVT